MLPPAANRALRRWDRGSVWFHFCFRSGPAERAGGGGRPVPGSRPLWGDGEQRSWAAGAAGEVLAAAPFPSGTRGSLGAPSTGRVSG